MDPRNLNKKNKSKETLKIIELNKEPNKRRKMKKIYNFFFFEKKRLVLQTVKRLLKTVRNVKYDKKLEKLTVFAKTCKMTISGHFVTIWTKNLTEWEFSQNKALHNFTALIMLKLLAEKLEKSDGLF